MKKYLFLLCFCSLSLVFPAEKQSPQEALMSAFLPPHDSRLKERSSEVPEEMILSQEIQDFIDHMFKVAAGERGDPAKRGMVGLAAPQIGVFKRIILVDIGVDTKRRTWGEIKVFINPRIIEQSSETHIDREGCFSVDSHVCGLVPRATRVKIAYLDRDGKAQCEEYTDYIARIFQHEIDHLDGIRFPDQVGEQGTLHWVEPDQYPEYRQSWQHWPVLFPWKGWIAMQEGKPYDINVERSLSDKATSHPSSQTGSSP